MRNQLTYYNGTYTESITSNLNTNRGFLYGDGLFETIIYKNGIIQYLSSHIERLKKGLKTLNISFNHENLENLLNEVLTKNLVENTNVRIKIIVFRNTGGLYTPSDNSSSVIITTQDLIEPTSIIPTLGVCENIKLPKSPLGNLKTISSLPYVLASIEKDNSIFDELIILNTNNEICECTSSNIFWRKGDTYFTPSLETGCIEGIMRKQVILELNNKKKNINEGVYSLEDIYNSDEIFVTNVTGRKTVIDFKPHF